MHNILSYVRSVAALNPLVSSPLSWVLALN
jgi:hypothetical protein